MYSAVSLLLVLSCLNKALTNHFLLPPKLQREVLLDAVEELLSRVQLHVEVRCPGWGNLSQG